MAQENLQITSWQPPQPVLELGVLHIRIFHNGHPYLTSLLIELNLTQDLHTKLTTELL
jgi:hypothetical protein